MTQLKTKDGVSVTIVNEIEIQGKKYFVVDAGPKCINNIYTKYLVCPVSQFERTEHIPDKVDVVT